MLVCVKFAYVVAGSAGKEISEEEGAVPLIPSFIIGAAVF